MSERTARLLNRIIEVENWMRGQGWLSVSDVHRFVRTAHDSNCSERTTRRTLELMCVTGRAKRRDKTRSLGDREVVLNSEYIVEG